MDLIQPALDRISEWGHKNGLSFNPTKTTMVMFTKNRRRVPFPDVKLEGTVLKPQDSLKYLGVDIHRNLSWLNHITQRANKCKYLLHKCRSIVSSSWGLSPAKMDWIYKAVIRPKMTYGSVVWAHNMGKVMNKKITHVQRLALLAMTQPLRSTPTAGLEALIGWMPLTIHSQEMGMRTYLRNKSVVEMKWDGMGNSHKKLGHLGLWSIREHRIIDPKFPRQARLCTYVWGDKQYHHKTVTMDHPMVIYTDASKENENVGYAWHASIHDYVMAEEIVPAKDINIFEAEVLAIQGALLWLKRNYEKDRLTTIYSDSMSAVTVLNGHQATNDVSLETMILIRELSSLIPIKLVWTKGHDGNTGNEYADMLARRGAANSRNIQYAAPFVPVSGNAIKKSVHNYFVDYWQTLWDDDDDSSCRISKLFYPSVRESTAVIRKPLKDLRILSQFITGHGLFKRHLRHWNVLDTYLCSLCGEEPEDPWHLWEHCPSLEQDRREIRKISNNKDLLENQITRFANCVKIRMLMASNETIVAK